MILGHSNPLLNYIRDIPQQPSEVNQMPNARKSEELQELLLHVHKLLEMLLLQF